MNYAVLQAYGIDYREGLNRCMNNISFYKKYIAMFLKDESFSNAKKAYSQKQYNELYVYVHELKGVCANAAFTDLHEAVCLVVELLRFGYQDYMEPELKKMFFSVEDAYKSVCEGINLALESE